MKNVTLFISICVCCLQLISAKTITGTVRDLQNTPLSRVNVLIQNTHTFTITDVNGHYTIKAEEGSVIEFISLGFKTQHVLLKNQKVIDVVLLVDNKALEKRTVRYEVEAEAEYEISQEENNTYYEGTRSHVNNMPVRETTIPKAFNESYASLPENGFKDALQTPLSTFSIDVDAASYSNMRRFIMNGQRPPSDAVRVEEMINYFDYTYPQPTNEHPFSINTEVANCPWNTNNKLVHIGLQGKSLKTKEAPASNLVFLIDVSGSMSNANKLPLLKKAYTLLVNQLRKKDRIAIVVYAGSSGLVLPSTAGNKKETILNALNNLQSGGGTAGGAGLKLAYQVAEENLIKGGNNRIILATDGDFNVGQSSDKDLENLIVKNRDKGIFMSVTGFGMGNYKDSKMEIIADKGNGNYSYIDTILEAKKVFVNEFSSTLFTIAKDVKIQIEFNPAYVSEYRLVGYENRLLKDEDFNNDKKDAGELGAGHTVTALYEIVPFGKGRNRIDSLKYQAQKTKPIQHQLNNELATVKFRYKAPDGNISKLITKTIENDSCNFNDTSESFQFSSAVASFGMLLKNSNYKEDLDYSSIIQIAKSSKGEDNHGYRSEFIRLVELASEL